MGCRDQVDMTVPSLEEQVKYQNGDVALAATLVTSGSGGPHPAVVFIHGSGRQTRDYYRIFADHFAKHGIAGLVYDKRGAPGCALTVRKDKRTRCRKVRHGPADRNGD